MWLTGPVLAALLEAFSFGAPPPPPAPELLVFAAASLTESAQELGKAYEAKGGAPVKFSFGASSDLARQIKAGAPADVFFSADTAKMDDLEKAGLVRKDDRREFLSNRLVVVVPAGAKTAPATAADLAKLPHVALADPQGVPAGVYAKKWLEALGLWEQIQPKVVPTLDVRAALAAVETEAAPAAVVYATDAAISKKVKVAFAVENGPEITYSLAKVAASKNPEAQAFVDYLASPAGYDVFRKHGFMIRSMAKAAALLPRRSETRPSVSLSR
jgi:molybdate transport system substrate-binding protein